MDDPSIQSSVLVVDIVRELQVEKNKTQIELQIQRKILSRKTSLYFKDLFYDTHLCYDTDTKGILMYKFLGYQGVSL